MPKKRSSDYWFGKLAPDGELGELYTIIAALSASLQSEEAKQMDSQKSNKPKEDEKTDL